ncbi:DUF1294 domain-containing protein [Puniceibacterium sp. IMCC21224]|uniref:DUF1294 domain-containing protein n=1 Tax=Puniceibacterium sp. IMCC21224 TaxID=1618204 RepID=UPI0012DFED7E|nr:DUF1294 domain-containing protein [Puniceibacterium sp. IMCC21224]
MNVWAFAAFWWDKRQAIGQRQRTPERTLLTLAFFGGWVGAKLGQRKFRHKTSKEPFRTRLNRIPVYWGLIAALVYFHEAVANLLGLDFSGLLFLGA